MIFQHQKYKRDKEQKYKRNLLSIGGDKRNDRQECKHQNLFKSTVGPY